MSLVLREKHKQPSLSVIEVTSVAFGEESSSHSGSIKTALLTAIHPGDSSVTLCWPVRAQGGPGEQLACHPPPSWLAGASLTWLSAPFRKCLDVGLVLVMKPGWRHAAWAKI